MFVCMHVCINVSVHKYHSGMKNMQCYSSPGQPDPSGQPTSGYQWPSGLLKYF